MHHRWSPLVLASAAALTVGLAACGDDGPESSTPSTAAPVVTTPESSAPSTDAPSTDAPSTDAGATTEAGEIPLDSGPTQEAAAEVLVGLSEDEAEEAAAEEGWTVRVVTRDGEDLAATMDFRPNRVNVEVTDGEVTDVVSVG